jgi:glycosyltransferase involved in cell wall biosynthesis
VISVLQFTNAVARGGAEEHILHLLKNLDRQCFKVHFACTNMLADRIENDLPADVELLRVDFEQPYQLSQAARFSAMLRERRIQILHSHMFYSGLCASPFGRLSRVPVIVETSHGREAWRKGWLKGSYVCDRLVGRCVDRYIAVSEATRRYLITDKGMPPDKISVIYPGSDLSRFDPQFRPAEDLRLKLGINTHDPVISFVGRLEPQKGHRVLLDSMPAVLRSFPTARLICAGEGRLDADLRGRVRELGLDGNVFFIGYPADIRDCLAVADLTVLPSLYEGLPVTPIESLASGRTMVATSVDGTPEVIIDGETGLLVPPLDPQALSNAICRLLKDNALRKRLAENGRRRVLDVFSVKRMVELTEQFYLKAWNEKRERVGTTDRAAARAGSN